MNKGRAVVSRGRIPTSCEQCGGQVWEGDTLITFLQRKKKLRTCATCAQDVLARRAAADDLVAAELEAAWRLPADCVGRPNEDCR